MINEKKEALYIKKIKTYVKENLKKGHHLDSIEQKLINSNVNPNIIEKAIGPHKKEKPKIKWESFILPVMIVLTIVLVIFNYNNLAKLFLTPKQIDSTPNQIDLSSLKIVTLQDYPECVNLETPFDRYSCYANKNTEEGNNECGGYFLGYEKERKEYLEKMVEGEIILKINGDLISNYIVKELESGFYDIMSEKQIGKPAIGQPAIIETNLGAYNYPYLEGPEGGPYLYLNLGYAFCKK
ncbi:MAG: hypothetical protein AABW92_01730 [Nanoarchaeota archaeon]